MRAALGSALLVLLTLARASAALPGNPADGELVARAALLPPPGAAVLPYANAGYRLGVSPEGVVEVEVNLAPLGSAALLGPLPNPARGPLERVAALVASGAVTRHEAVSRVLGWISREIRYELDRERPQDPVSVLLRRSAHCTGVARLAVALLGALSIEAREVAGFVAAEPSGGEYHRWIEVFYPDRGWVFSDPLRYHDYVPPTYVRFASELVAPEGAASGLLLEREGHDGEVGRNPWAREGVRARSNGRGAGPGGPRGAALGGAAGGCDVDGGRVATGDRPPATGTGRGTGAGGRCEGGR